MKYIKFSLSDNTLVKFKIKRLIPSGLNINWKYVGRFNFVKDIKQDIPRYAMESEIDFLQQITDEELIAQYKGLIEKEHEKIKKTKRKI